MPFTLTEIRRGAYYDSVVLMQLQKSLVSLPGILDAGVVMGTDANKEVLHSSNLLSAEANDARQEDLVIAISAQDDVSAHNALAQVDELLRRRQTTVDEEYRPKSLDSALEMLSDAQWVLVSVPGRYAAGVARDALNLGRNVFLYSDNVSGEDEISLKQAAREKGLLVMGPDCGTAIINGVGLGFANKVRRGNIGIVAASGTGLQTVSVGIDRLGGGTSHALGTGTHDLSDAVQAITTLQGIELLKHDRETKVIVLISKPPSPNVAALVLDAAQKSGKHVVVDFIGYIPEAKETGNLHFAHTLDETAEQAIALASGSVVSPLSASESAAPPVKFAASQRYLRGLYSGGTLAYEAQLIARERGLTIYSNAPLDKNLKLASSNASHEHAIIDLGADEFMVGRLHPMIDNDLRIRRLRQEADDASVAVILLDVVLGYGAHPDPASELAAAIHETQQRVLQNGRALAFIAVVIGTEQDPQNYSSQVEQLRAVGVFVTVNHTRAVSYACELVERLNGKTRPHRSLPSHALSADLAQATSFAPVNLDALQKPFAGINIGLGSFYTSLKEQGAPTIQVDWKPPAGGNEKLMALLTRMKSKS